MAEFANTVYGEPVNYVVTEDRTLGMSRGNKGFFAMGDLNREFDTGLPDGDYCDIISECQQKITVRCNNILLHQNASNTLHIKRGTIRSEKPSFFLFPFFSHTKVINQKNEG